MSAMTVGTGCDRYIIGFDIGFVEILYLSVHQPRRLLRHNVQPLHGNTCLYKLHMTVIAHDKKETAFIMLVTSIQSL